jgi:hypothetical protein
MEEAYISKESGLLSTKNKTQPETPVRKAAKPACSLRGFAREPLYRFFTV